jgi:hypothetical protein
MKGWKEVERAVTLNSKNVFLELRANDDAYVAFLDVPFAFEVPSLVEGTMLLIAMNVLVEQQVKVLVMDGTTFRQLVRLREREGGLDAWMISVTPLEQRFSFSLGQAYPKSADETLLADQVGKHGMLHDLEVVCTKSVEMR